MCSIVEGNSTVHNLAYPVPVDGLVRITFTKKGFNEGYFEGKPVKITIEDLSRARNIKNTFVISDQQITITPKRLEYETSYKVTVKVGTEMDPPPVVEVFRTEAPPPLKQETGCFSVLGVSNNSTPPLPSLAVDLAPQSDQPHHQTRLKSLHTTSEALHAQVRLSLTAVSALFAGPIAHDVALRSALLKPTLAALSLRHIQESSGDHRAELEK